MIRKIESTLGSTPVLEGAGVKLQRVFGYPRKGWLDPFLMLDHFGSDDPVDYMAGFPWHPHRGIETVTYMLSGEVEHEDSMRNKGVIKSGDIQWMTAGSGILHQEMPQKFDGVLSGFQLWVNLPASHKMMAPRYQDIPAYLIPAFDWKGIHIRLAAGKFGEFTGPVKDIVVKPLFMDMTVPVGIQQTFDVNPDHTFFAYVFEGSAYFDQQMTNRIGAGTLVKLISGDQIFIASDKTSARFLLIGGKPLHEEIAWRGPIVMNTKEELYQAFEDYQTGNFVKK
ncbi:MAG: pirin family protein [Porphyromonadaceae bacterium]|nr:MAG: pirin family protein [Porphyromonadaceae bacterium]